MFLLKFKFCYVCLQQLGKGCWNVKSYGIEEYSIPCPSDIYNHFQKSNQEHLKIMGNSWNTSSNQNKMFLSTSCSHWNFINMFIISKWKFIYIKIFPHFLEHVDKRRGTLYIVLQRLNKKSWTIWRNIPINHICNFCLFMTLVMC